MSYSMQLVRVRDELNRAKDQVNHLTGRMEALEKLVRQERLALLDKLGDRTVIRFQKQYYDGQTYHYAAIRVWNLWYLTTEGSNARQTTEQLKKFIGDGLVEIMTPDKGL